MLVIDDEPEVLESISLILRHRHIDVHTASSGREAIEVFSENPVGVVVCDNSLPDIQGIELLSELRNILPEVQIIMITGKGTIDIAVSAMKAGVFDFLIKPVQPEHLVHLLFRAMQFYDALTEKKRLKEDVERMTDQYIVGNHPSIKDMLRLIYTVAPTDSTVLIEGESGTGKELVARLVHQRSERSGRPFVAVDCGALPEGLVESELFGCEKGAFTGAASARIGRFERAHKGTLFLDEITSLPPSLQVKLLRALQEKVVERLGGKRPIPVDIRLIAATNCGLRDAVEDGKFREDLYYRLNILTIKIPPLRERKSDIAPLVSHFIRKLSPRVKDGVKGVSKEGLRAMMDYSWPGNVRELENAVEHGLIMAASSLIMPCDLPDFGGHHAPLSTLDETEKHLLIKAIKDAGGVKGRAAKALGIPRSSLYSKLKKFNLLQR